MSHPPTRSAGPRRAGVPVSIVGTQGAGEPHLVGSQQCQRGQPRGAPWGIGRVRSQRADSNALTRCGAMAPSNPSRSTRSTLSSGAWDRHAGIQMRGWQPAGGAEIARAHAGARHRLEPLRRRRCSMRAAAAVACSTDTRILHAMGCARHSVTHLAARSPAPRDVGVVAQHVPTAMFGPASPEAADAQIRRPTAQPPRQEALVRKPRTEPCGMLLGAQGRRNHRHAESPPLRVARPSPCPPAPLRFGSSACTPTARGSGPSHSPAEQQTDNPRPTAQSTRGTRNNMPHDSSQSHAACCWCPGAELNHRHADFPLRSASPRPPPCPPAPLRFGSSACTPTARGYGPSRSPVEQRTENPRPTAQVHSRTRNNMPHDSSQSHAACCWCPGAELNHRHADFQSAALPTELPGRSDRRIIDQVVAGVNTITHTGHGDCVQCSPWKF